MQTELSQVLFIKLMSSFISNYIVILSLVVSCQVTNNNRNSVTHALSLSHSLSWMVQGIEGSVPRGKWLGCEADHSPALCCVPKLDSVKLYLDLLICLCGTLCN
jgi:hypothetical protein